MTLFEIYLKINGYPIKKASNEILKIQKLDTKEFIEWQENKKWEIVKYHFHNNDLYKKLVGSHLPTKWEELPVLNKSDYQNKLKEILSEPYKSKRIYISNTSGSSGHPFFFAKDKYSHAITWAIIKNRYQLYNLTLKSKQARFYGIPLAKRQYYKEIIKDRIMNRLRFPVFDLSEEVLEVFFNKFKKTKFDYLYGYTNSLVIFAKYIAKKGMKLQNICPSLKICITTSEVLVDSDRKLMEESFGILVVNEYGASEIGILAFQFPDQNFITSVENVFFETLNLEFDKKNSLDKGEILVTSLFNKAMPVIRYRIGDIGKLAQNNSEPVFSQSLECLEGRTNDLIILPNGKISPGFTLYYVSKGILEKTRILKEFIVKQTAIDEFILEVVTERELTNEEENIVKKQMYIHLQEGIKITIKRVDEIQKPESGKIKHFYSYINK